MRLKKSKYQIPLESLSDKRSDSFDPPGQIPLELTQEGEATLVSGVVNKRPTGATHVEIRFEDQTLTIKAMYQPKQRKEAYTGSISLPLDLTEPSYLFPLLEGERPWVDWLQIEGFAREAVDVMPIPVRLAKVFDQHLMALKTARNGPAVSALLSARPTEQLRKRALAGQSDAKVAEHVRVLPESLRFLANTREAKQGAISSFGNFLRQYEEFLRERQRRDAMTVYERMTEELRLEEEKQVRSRG